MRLAFLYAGQGSQHVGMGEDFYASEPDIRPYFDRTIDGLSLKTLCFEGPESLLFQTRYNQVAMSAFALAVTDILKKKGLQPCVAAGLSLGEYNALYAAEAADADTILELLRVRGAAMQAACETTPGAMAAVMGLDAEKIREVCAQVEADTGELARIANYNSSGQYVIAGAPLAMEQVAEPLRLAGAKRIVPLAVSGAFHTPLMASAVEPVKKALNSTKWENMICPVISNVTAQPIGADQLEEELSQQITSPVRFEETMDHLVSHELDGIIEIGPGKAIASFLKRSPLKGIPMVSIRVLADIDAACSLFGGQHE